MKTATKRIRDRSAPPDRWDSPKLFVYHGPGGRSSAEIPTPEPAKAGWCIYDFRFEILAWTDAQWSRLSEADKPDNATPLQGIGWCLLRPAAN